MIAREGTTTMNIVYDPSSISEDKVSLLVELPGGLPVLLVGGGGGGGSGFSIVSNLMEESVELPSSSILFD